MGERLFLLQIAGGGFVLARRTESGQFSPVGEVKKETSLRFSPEYLGHLRNVAAWVAFELKEQYPNMVGFIETWDPDTIAEGKPSDSLRVLVGDRRVERRLEGISETLFDVFGAKGISNEDKGFLLKAVKQAIDGLADIAYGEKPKTK